MEHVSILFYFNLLYLRNNGYIFSTFGSLGCLIFQLWVLFDLGFFDVQSFHVSRLTFICSGSESKKLKIYADLKIKHAFVKQNASKKVNIRNRFKRTLKLISFFESLNCNLSRGIFTLDTLGP
jgi:hypothetical protein